MIQVNLNFFGSNTLKSLLLISSEVYALCRLPRLRVFPFRRQSMYSLRPDCMSGTSQLTQLRIIASMKVVVISGFVELLVSLKRFGMG